VGEEAEEGLIKSNAVEAQRPVITRASGHWERSVEVKEGVKERKVKLEDEGGHGGGEAGLSRKSEQDLGDQEQGN
jgi:hypothetical protein